MDRFCGSCGTPHAGGAFCSSCGRPMTAPPTPGLDEPTVVRPPAPPAPDFGPPPEPGTAPAAAPPPYAAPPAPAPAPPPYAAPPAYGPPPQAPYAAPAAPRINPLIGWPVGDYVRDAAAAFFLFSTLGMPWTIDPLGEDAGGHRWWVIIAVLLSVASLVVPYLAKARVVPGWTPQQYLLAKVGLNVPFVVSAVVAVLIELAHVADPDQGGVGSGVAMGLAGVTLAVQRRAAEEDADPRRGSDDALWCSVATLTAYVAAGLAALTTVTFLLHTATDDYPDPASLVLAGMLGTGGLVLALTAWPAVQQRTGAPAWVRVYATGAFTVVVVALFALAGDRAGLFDAASYEKWDTPGAGTFVLGIAAALAVSRPRIRQGQAQVDPATGWLGTVGAALVVSAAASAVGAVTLLLVMIGTEFSGSKVTALVLTVITGAVAGFGVTLTGDLRRNRMVLLGLLGGIVVVGCVAMGLLNSGDVGPAVPAGLVAAWWTLPVLAAFSLTVPPSVRGALGPLVVSGPTGGTYPPPPYGPPPGQPGQQPPPPGYGPPPTP